jgi:hypothetical protein
MKVLKDRGAFVRLAGQAHGFPAQARGNSGAQVVSPGIAGGAYVVGGAYIASWAMYAMRGEASNRGRWPTLAIR